MTSAVRKKYEARGEGEKVRKMRNAQRKRNYAKTAKYERRIWTDEEDKRVLAHDIPDQQLSSEIRRSVQAIQIRRARLKAEY